jgi:hypothetical protein
VCHFRLSDRITAIPVIRMRRRQLAARPLFSCRYYLPPLATPGCRPLRESLPPQTAPQTTQAMESMRISV